MRKKRVFTICIIIIISLVFLDTKPVMAMCYPGSNIISNNIHDHVYSGNAKVSNSYLMKNADGTLTRIENYGDVILCEKYSSAFKVISQSTIPFELSIFGGFYSGEKYNYFVFGQNNYANEQHAECIRIVQYTKDWKRRNVYSVGDCNVSVPFYGTNTDFSEYGDNLYIRCGHLSYSDGTGRTWQGPLTISVKQQEAVINDVQGSLLGITKGSIVNVGATYIDTSGGMIITMDHSLSAPVGAVCSCYYNNASVTSFESETKTAKSLGSAIGYNGYVPPLSIGGFELGSQYYLAACSTGITDGSAYNNNIVIMAVPRNGFTDAEVKLSYITGYAGETYTCETPYLVKVSSDKYCVLFEIRDGYSDMCRTYYAFVDGSGNKISDIEYIDGCLSDCQPIVYNNKIVWYTTNGDCTNIYCIPTSAGSSGSASKDRVYDNSSAVYKGVDFSKVYDFSYYCSHYPDVRVLYSNNPQGAISHFVNTGMSEGRQACENFNVQAYKSNYSDLRGLYGGDLKKYYVHFVLYGSNEGRNGRTYN